MTLDIPFGSRQDADMKRLFLQLRWTAQMSGLMRFSCTVAVLILFSGFSSAGENEAPSAATVSVSLDGRALLIKRSSDTEPVRVPVLDQCGNPAVGEARIRNIQQNNGEVIATYGKHCWATLLLKDRVLKCNGCD